MNVTDTKIVLVRSVSNLGASNEGVTELAVKGFSLHSVDEGLEVIVGRHVETSVPLTRKMMERNEVLVVVRHCKSKSD